MPEDQLAPAADVPPQYDEKDGADLPAEDRALPDADQTPELDFEDTDDVDLADGTDEEI